MSNRHVLSQFARSIAKYGVKANPPASSNAIIEMAQRLGAVMPPDLVALYELHDGMSERGHLPFRQLSIAETIQTHHEILETRADFDFPSEARVFWADDAGNYAGLFVDGDFRGKLCFFDHEESDYSPRFQDLVSFLRSQLDAAKRKLDWSEMDTNFPLVLAVGSTTESEFSRLKELLQKMEDTGDANKRCKIAFNVMALWPSHDDSLLIKCLNDKDAYVQERAAEILGKRRSTGAIVKLAETVRRDPGRIPNARIAALLALGQMRSKESLDLIKTLRNEIPDSYVVYVAKAYELHGCKMKCENKSWWYQLPKEREWNPV